MADGIDGSYVPEFSGPFRNWAINYARQQVWRFHGQYEVDDLIQEAAIKFLHCRDRYQVHEPQHFMALFKTAVTRHFHSLARGFINLPEFVSNEIDGVADGMGADYRDLISAVSISRELKVNLRTLRRIDEKVRIKILKRLLEEHMSKIQDELLTLTGLRREDYDDEQEFLNTLVQKVDEEVPDDDWNKLSTETQDWVSKAVDKYVEGDKIPALTNGKATKKSEPTKAKKAKSDSSEEKKRRYRRFSEAATVHKKVDELKTPKDYGLHYLGRNHWSRLQEGVTLGELKQNDAKLYGAVRWWERHGFVEIKEP